jgi:hypothetical protein
MALSLRADRSSLGPLNAHPPEIASSLRSSQWRHRCNIKRSE